MGLFDSKKKAETIKLVNDRISEKYEVKIIYVKVQCGRCGKQFGISPNNANEISEADMVCTKCLRERMFEN